MGEWVIGAVINLFGSIAINFGTNLLKLGHDEREKHSVLGNEGTNVKATMKPIIYFQTWRVGILFFAIGNCLNFISFGYAAQQCLPFLMMCIFVFCLIILVFPLWQSLLAALGSIQFVSNIAFAYFVLNKTVTINVLVATAFIVLGNIFLVAFGNHQSPVYTPEQLAEKYSNITFLLYCLTLVLVVALHHSIYNCFYVLEALLQYISVNFILKFHNQLNQNRKTSRGSMVNRNYRAPLHLEAYILVNVEVDAKELFESREREDMSFKESFSLANFGFRRKMPKDGSIKRANFSMSEEHTSKRRGFYKSCLVGSFAKWVGSLEAIRNWVAKEWGAVDGLKITQMNDTYFLFSFVNKEQASKILNGGK
ncbi:hypothetical protein HAX54_031492 [Datura stramonium]|uniref:Probable magnesium transporter n=1 Tax=Datura stramonium TaxID=4076 RepID=A0ABS8VC73_DATST|nr:hypothetical protein [Datura stramonium]